MLSLVNQNNFDNPVRESWQTCDKSGVPTVWSADPVTKMPSEVLCWCSEWPQGWALNWLIKNSFCNEFAINLMSLVNAPPMAKFLVNLGSFGNNNCFKLSLSFQEYKEISLLVMARRMFCPQSSRADAQSCPSKWLWQSSERILTDEQQVRGTYSLICWPSHKDAKWDFYVVAQNGCGVSSELMN